MSGGSCGQPRWQGGGQPSNGHMGHGGGHGLGGGMGGGMGYPDEMGVGQMGGQMGLGAAQMGQMGQNMGGQNMGGAPPPVNQSVSMREADERAAAELLWAGQMGGAMGGHMGGGGGEADLGMGGGVNPNARTFTPGGGAMGGAMGGGMGGGGMGGGGMGGPQQPGCGGSSSFNGGGGGGLPARQPSLEDLSLRAAAENLWGQTGSTGQHPPPATQSSLGVGSAGSYGGDAPHPGLAASRGLDSSYGAAPAMAAGGLPTMEGTSLPGSMAGYDGLGGVLGDVNGGCGCLPTSLASLGIGVPSQVGDPDALGASSLLASLGIGESDGALPGLPGLPRP